MSWTITGNPVALCDTQHAGKEIVTKPMSEYFANNPECHDLLPCALRSHRVAGLGGMSHSAVCGWIHVHVDSGPVALCGPVALYLLQWQNLTETDQIWPSIDRIWPDGVKHFQCKTHASARKSFIIIILQSEFCGDVASTDRQVSYRCLQSTSLG